MSVSCNRVEPANDDVPCLELDSDGSATWNFDEFDYKTVEPGIYTIIYNVCVDGLPDTCEEMPITIVLSDPCNPPASITTPTLDDQDYVITDHMIPYTHPDFVADPAFCPVRYEYDVPSLRNGNKIIEQKGGDQKFETYYEADLSPIDEDITVTIKAISESGWTTTRDIESSPGTFVVRSEGPCDNTDYVNIIPKAFPDYDYIVNDDALPFAAHPEFDVDTKPLVGHNLCGDL